MSELPPYPSGKVVGPCVCGSWPGGECCRCPQYCPLPDGYFAEPVRKKL